MVPREVDADGARRTYSGAPWERTVGYCRALRKGPMVWVTGTAPVAEDGTVVAPGDAYLQARRCLEIVQEALRAVGAGVEDVVRTRIYVTDISEWEAVGRAHREVFEESPPATTLVQVAALIDPEMRVEIEADAYVVPGG